MPMPRTLAYSLPEFSADKTIHRGLAGASPRHVVKENQRLILDMQKKLCWMKPQVSQKNRGCPQKHRSWDVPVKGWSDETVFPPMALLLGKVSGNQLRARGLVRNVQHYHEEATGANGEWDVRYVGCPFRGTARHREFRVDKLALCHRLKKSWESAKHRSWDVPVNQGIEMKCMWPKSERCRSVGQF